MGAEEDYKALEGMDNLGAADRKIVRDQLRVLPARTKAAQEKETAEMWDKLKDVSITPSLRCILSALRGLINALTSFLAR